MSLAGEKSSNRMLTVMIAVLVAATLFSMSLYQNAAVTRIRNRTYAAVGANAQERKTGFISGLEWQYLSLETIAQGLVLHGAETMIPMLADLRQLSEKTDYLKVYLADSNGDTDTETGRINIADRAYFKQALAGERGLERVLSRIDGQMRFAVSVPVTVDGTVAYVLYATCKDELLDEMLQVGTNYAGSYTLVCAVNGQRIIGGEAAGMPQVGGNLFTDIAPLMPEDQLQTLRADFANARSGIAAYGRGAAGVYIAYVPLGINNWMVCSAVPSESVDEEVVQTVRSGYLIILAIMIISAAFVLLFAYLINESSHRILRDQTLLAESDARYRMAIENTAVALWDFDIHKQRLSFDERSMHLIGAEQQVIESAVETLILEGFIHEESADDMRQLHNKLANGEKNPEAVIRMRGRLSDSWQYEHVRYTNLFDEKGAPYLAIGMGEDVTAEYIERRKMVELSAAVDRDSMTGLLNHGATFNHIKACLKNEGLGGTHALFMIDIDDFKKVNDTLGHQTGDDTIKKIALAIKKTFRASDIVGRVGGDEFMVLMKNVPDLSYVHKKGRELVEALRIPCYANDYTVSVSASVGIALYWGNGRPFEQIYADADGALYRAKSAGKDRYVVDREDAQA